MKISSGTYSPVTMFQGRHNDMYGVHGQGRGFRWDGDSAEVEPIGMVAPTGAPTITASTAGQRYFITNIQMVTGGAGYFGTPTVSATGGGATQHAQLRARVNNGRVLGVDVVEPGAGYTGTPTIEFSGGIASGAALTANVVGGVDFIEITNSGSGYTNPAVTISKSNGLTGANFAVDEVDGKIIGVQILARGDGATTTPELSFTGGGTNAAAIPVISYRVDSVSIASSGSNFYTPPVITIFPAPDDLYYGGPAQVTCSISSGGIDAVTVLAGGAYSKHPTAKVIDTSAQAQATVAKTLRGKYTFAIRYVDDTTADRNGPIPSNIGTLTEVDIPDGAQTFQWSWSNASAEDRTHKVELWRTTADQSVVLYRVASLAKAGGLLPTTYNDSLSDEALIDSTRQDYGIMPIVLPSGQLNARRFGLPPTTMSVACMFQDRAWYAVDTSGDKPNSLYFSEIDEPESVPEENEVIVQENAADPDAITALVPFGSALLIGQSRHIYKLQYVAQPVIDASVILVAYRGVLNNRCWAVMGGVCFVVDSYGLYAFDGNAESAASVPVDNYWRDNIIDFTKQQYFYVQADPADRIVRFFYCRSTDGTYPRRALCYCAATKAWWEEEFPQEVPYGTVAVIGKKQVILTADHAGGFLKHAGMTDAASGAGVSYSLLTNTAKLLDEPSRAVGVLYKPTPDSSELKLALHYNNSSSPRANAISSDRGSGFVTTVGSTAAALDMKLTRSALGDSRGYSKAHYAGRLDDRSAGADRHIAVSISGTQAITAGNEVVLYGLTVEGAG